MLKLKRLELLGFKSFADRTRLEFQDGTVSIVGPNGCGKSNLSDAMNWVLGEQSARLLRGERMTDVIFNGTGSRPPTGMAEVSLTLADPEYDSSEEPAEDSEPVKAQSADYADSTDLIQSVRSADSTDNPKGEASEIERSAAGKRAVYRGYLKDGSGHITVTRRLFRYGESEYLINGRASRLRDIQDLFMGTGLGPESYAIIEQGRIGQILSSKPSDRRLILEEAAGISKFKARKRAAELKLESSRGNLSRITDILEEVIKQVSSLKRQASKARRFRELHDEMMGRQKITLASRLRILESQCQQLRKDSETLQQLSAEESRGLELLTNEQRSTTARCEELEGRLISIRETLSENELERQRLQSRLEQIRQQIAALDSRSADAKQESGQVRSRMESLEREAELRAQEHEALLHEQASAEEDGARLQAKQEELGQRIREAERAVEQSRQALLACLSRASNLRNQLVQAEEMGLALERQAARISEERAGVEAERVQSSTELEMLSQENARFQNELAQLAESVSQTAAALDQAQKAEAAERRDLENLRREFSGMQARKQTLEESLARHAYSTESVRRLLNGEFPSNGHHFRPLGVLADFLEVSPGYEEVVEEFLKSELDCVVVEQHAEARSGIAILQAEGTGRSTFFVTRADAAGHLSGNGHHQISQEPGVVASLREMVRLEPRLGLNGDPPLPSLDKAYLVEDAAAAERLAAGYPECHFVTRSGEHYHHRLVSGGRGSSAGPLALRRDFRDLERRTVEVESAIQARETGLAAFEEQVRTLGATLGGLTAARQESEKNSVVGSERLRQVQQALARAIERLRVFEEESRRLEAERLSLESKQVAIRAQLEAEEAEKVRLEAEIAFSSETVGVERQRFDHGAQALAQAQARFSSLQERTRALAAERERLAAQAREMGDRADYLARQVSGWEENQRQLAAEADSERARNAGLENTHSRLKQELQGVGDELQTVRTRRDQLRPQVEQARARYEAAREKRSEVEIALARAESDRDHHAVQCRESLQQEPETLLAELAAEVFLVGEALELAEEEVRQLKKKIDNLGPLNMMALEELKEAEERYEFLESQRQDLLASIEDTAQAIREIDRLSRLQFMEAFKAINIHFAESFRTLFGGGIGQLRLTDEEDPDSGLDIVAQPPGKRLQNILLLSGGEKALAALALLIAIFRYTPSPFCVLDEVDAPLDDTNVGRFTRMIQRMSAATQFILITHNKTTMEIARAIYGVTMEEPGVSKLISVQLEAFEEEPVAITA
ncbi:MAG TPA: chromosome segregation protein SMC [Terriglobia bacterium]|nr:chromosome segregation protein SMC [Terriglobia bacterium]